MNLQEMQENGATFFLFRCDTAFKDGRRHLPIKAEAANGVAGWSPAIPLGTALNGDQVLGDLENEMQN